MAMPLAVPRYTIADLDSWPEDGNRYELLDGVLLVTPGPGPRHQNILGRLNMQLAPYLARIGTALIVCPGVLQHRDNTQLQPDLLVIPADGPDDDSWRSITDWWLAVEISGRSSRVYDRDFKCDAYLRLGVPEFWRLDMRDRCLYRSRAGEVETPFRDRMTWHPSAMPSPLAVEVPPLFGPPKRR
jgi:Uma2 family endonuclease